MAAVTQLLTRSQRWQLLNWEKWNAYIRGRYAANPEVHRAQAANRQRRFRLLHPERQQRFVNPQGERERVNAVHAAKRLEALNALGGPVCVGCGYDKDIRALQIDHINGGGRADRQTVSGSPYSFYLKVIKIGRATYQVLCANCNAIKRSVNRESYYKR